jgi:hypothetical protein
MVDVGPLNDSKDTGCKTTTPAPYAPKVLELLITCSCSALSVGKSGTNFFTAAGGISSPRLMRISSSIGGYVPESW